MGAHEDIVVEADRNPSPWHLPQPASDLGITHPSPRLTGTGAHEDIVVSSARAYVSALNKMIGWMSVRQKAAPRASSRQESPASASMDRAVA